MNDGYKPLWAFHTTVRDNPDYLISQIAKDQPDKERWKEYRNQIRADKAGSTEELAWKFYYKMVYSFGQLGQVYAPKFHCRDSLKIEKFNNASRLLQGVRITNQDFREVVALAKGKIYLDPPYFSDLEKTTSYYGCKFDMVDHDDLVELLEIKDNWLLSYDNHPESRKRYSKYKMIKLNVKRSMGQNGEARGTDELFIMPK
jgi:site-specific DNA-adenine methylase